MACTKGMLTASLSLMLWLALSSIGSHFGFYQYGTMISKLFVYLGPIRVKEVLNPIINKFPNIDVDTATVSLTLCFPPAVGGNTCVGLNLP